MNTLKRIIREEMDHSIQWIKDIKSNQDIAQEIADETKIKKNKLLNTPFPSFPTNVPLHHINAQFPSFIKYGKKRYGLNDEDDIQDVWKRYKKLIKGKVNSIHESDEMQWIKDIKPIPELKIGTCFIDVMDSTKTEWIIIDFKMTPGGTPIVVIKNKKNNVDIRYKHEGYFEEDLLSGRYKRCGF